MGLSLQLLDKIIFVTDQRANIKKTIEKSNLRFNCFAHVLNLILKAIFSNQNEIISSDILKLIDNAKLIVTHFNRTHKARNLEITLKQFTLYDVKIYSCVSG